MEKEESSSRAVHDMTAGSPMRGIVRFALPLIFGYILQQMYDVIAGTFLVVGLGAEDFASLSPELAQKYEEHFHQPEAFLPLGRRLMVIPVPDESVQSDAEKAVSKPSVEHDR